LIFYISPGRPDDEELQRLRHFAYYFTKGDISRRIKRLTKVPNPQLSIEGTDFFLKDKEGRIDFRLPLREGKGGKVGIGQLGGTRLPTQTLRGIRIAIDPTLIGGPIARFESKTFGPDKVVAADLNLTMATKLASELEAVGATVQLLRDSTPDLTMMHELFNSSVEDILTLLLLDSGVKDIASNYILQYWERAIEAKIKGDYTELKAVYRQCVLLRFDLQKRAEKLKAFAPHVFVSIYCGCADASTPVPEERHRNYFLYIPGAFGVDEINERENRKALLRHLLYDTATPSLELAQRIQS